MEIQENISLKPYTVFQIGGPARFFAKIRSHAELKEASDWAVSRGLPVFILGLGSNVLISDSGFPGLAIKIEFSKISQDGESVIVESGARMAEVVNFALNHGLVGFEWAIGVPGTIGGAIRGNAGCYGSETKDFIEVVETYDIKNREIKTFSNADCSFRYRESMFKKHPELIILSALLKLSMGNVNKARLELQKYSKARLTSAPDVWREFYSAGGNPSSQEIGAKTAGSMFRNILWTKKGVEKKELISKFPRLKAFENMLGIPAGFLIEEAGLKGIAKIGGAMVSAKHANFVINIGDAKAEDVLMLISLIKERIHRTFGLFLEEEIQLVGFS